MKPLITTVLLLFLSSCASQPETEENQASHQACLGDTTVPEMLADSFELVQDDELLNAALGGPNEGKLCQGQVLQSKEDSQIIIFRAWNSTNPNSEMGNWWALERPSGKVAQYRADYEICYQWSPLDKLASCTLKPGVKVVIGTGQSATCSEYLSYPVSDKQQIFISDASASVADCSTLDGEFSWK